MNPTKEEGRLCLGCEGVPEAGESVCASCAEKEEWYMTTEHATRLMENLCKQCGEASPVGKRICGICAEKHRQDLAARREKWREKKRVAGLCKSCRVFASEKDSAYCTSCIHKLAQSRKIERARRTLYRKKRRCVACGKRAETRSYCLTCWFSIIARSTRGDGNTYGPLLRRIFNEQGGLCAYTKTKLVPGKNASLDHKIPTSRGGITEKKNLQWVTEQVNRMKTDMLEDEFLACCAKIVDLRVSPHPGVVGPF